ncbi:alpha/beta hydrolase [Egibacter rhizosphaerae]|uniref:Alpha/beta hydrolase n=1 Tax=Egibacter rhizosphaerae TaxID=1670831 RepID=A0A411YJ40_9ACTN|nr:alpha/beta hydrolase family protein [Egibacter rhizosphaerae]QBI21139.1 alpha/beta hydrolase [Egibacter rhizosphaerae]
MIKGRHRVSTPAAELELRWREADDGATDRPPLLFVHGVKAGAWVWELWMAAAAARGWRSAALSLRGHGQSGGRERLSRWRLRDYEDDVMRAVAEMPEPPVLVGHSMGGLLVRRVLVRSTPPAAVLVTPAGARDGLGVTALLARRRPWQFLRSLAFRSIRLDASDVFSPALPPAAAEAYVAQLQDESPLAQLEIAFAPRPRTAGCPLLVLGAGEDKLVPPVEFPRTARIYGGGCVMFAGMGHGLMAEGFWDWPLATMLGWLDAQRRDP